eukprot:3191680-Rhodomonas_salina.2
MASRVEVHVWVGAYTASRRAAGGHSKAAGGQASREEYRRSGDEDGAEPSGAERSRYNLGPKRNWSSESAKMLRKSTE